MWLAYKGERGGKLNLSAKRDKSTRGDFWDILQDPNDRASRSNLTFGIPPPFPLYTGHTGYNTRTLLVTVQLL